MEHCVKHPVFTSLLAMFTFFYDSSCALACTYKTLSCKIMPVIRRSSLRHRLAFPPQFSTLNWRIFCKFVSRHAKTNICNGFACVAGVLISPNLLGCRSPIKPELISPQREKMQRRLFIRIISTFRTTYFCCRT